jgi:hypothetical protein
MRASRSLVSLSVISWWEGRRRRGQHPQERQEASKAADPITLAFRKVSSAQLPEFCKFTVSSGSTCSSRVPLVAARGPCSHSLIHAVGDSEGWPCHRPSLLGGRAVRHVRRMCDPVDVARAGGLGTYRSNGGRANNGA